MKRQLLLNKLRAGTPVKLVDAPLAGADLSGAKIANCELLAADLSGANLRAARFTRVDMRLANLRDACLEDASFEMVDATGAVFSATAERTSFEFSNLSSADFSRARLTGACFRRCALAEANFSDCNLSSSTIVGSDCVKASFRRARLERVTTIGSSFHGVDLEDAALFYRSNELVYEILSREIADGSEQMSIIGGILSDRGRCYDEWRQYLEGRPLEREIALRCFGKYPMSGCLQALGQDAGRE